jgi:hypothetical protein
MPSHGLCRVKARTSASGFRASDFSKTRNVCTALRHATFFRRVVADGRNEGQSAGQVGGGAGESLCRGLGDFHPWCCGYWPQCRWLRPPAKISMPANLPRKFSRKRARTAIAARASLEAIPARASCANIIPPARTWPRPWRPIYPPPAAIRGRGPRSRNASPIRPLRPAPRAHENRQPRTPPGIPGEHSRPGIPRRQRQDRPEAVPGRCGQKARPRPSHLPHRCLARPRSSRLPRRCPHRPSRNSRNRGSN